MIYIFIYIFLSILVLAKIFCGEKMNKIELIVFFALIILLIVNFPLGPDLPSYVFSFNRVSSPIEDAFKYNMQRNIGFNIFLFYAKQISNNYIFFRVFFNVAVSALYGITIFRYSKNKLFSMLIFLGAGYYIVYYGSGIRQMFSMCLFFFAYFFFLLNKKDILYLLFSIIAFSFHEAGAICFFIYIIYKMRNLFFKYPKIFFVISCICSITIFLASTTFLPTIIEKYQYISVFTHVLTYLNNISIDVMGIALRTILIILDILLYILSPNKNNKSKVMLLTMISIYLFYMAFSGFSLVARIYDFVAIIEIIMIPYYVFYMKMPVNKIVCTIIILGLNLILMINDIKFACNSDYISNKYDFNKFPYITIFETDKINSLIEE